MDLLPAGCAVIRHERRRLPSGQCALPRGEFGAAVSGALPHDAPALALRGGRRCVRISSAARGVGCLDIGAQGRFEHIPGDDRAAALHAICRASNHQALPAGIPAVHPQRDGQTDVGDVSIRPAAARLLAAVPRSVAAEVAPAAAGSARKSALIAYEHRCQRPHVPGAAELRRRRIAPARDTFDTCGECRHRLCDLHDTGALARQPGRPLSGNAAATGQHRTRPDNPAGSDSRGAGIRPDAALPAYRLVLVSWACCCR